MWFSKRQNNRPAENEHVARLLADKIIRIQQSTSKRLNSRVNKVSRQVQLRWFWLGCTLTILAILLSVMITFNRHMMPRLNSNMPPTHIGKSSDGIPPRPALIKDSVNAKK